MKERPIILKQHEVLAVLSGRQTQFRRVVKPQPSPELLAAYAEIRQRYGDQKPDAAVLHECIPCPYGQPGDRLWVREAWADEHPLAIQEGRYSQAGRAGIPGPPPVEYRTIYRADGEPLQIWRKADQAHPYFALGGPATQLYAEYPTVASNYTKRGQGIHWCNSIHMPRWASRITLAVTGVRVERLQDISDADAIAEGVSAINRLSKEQYRIKRYKDIWESINGPGSWDANPWVWVVEFKRIEK
jgi:hypothetical protein